MKKIILYSPGLSSYNLGDKIIAESAKNEIDFIIKDAFVTEISTHLPQSFYYMRHSRNVDYKFVLGSNLLKSTFFGFKKQWDITLRMAKITGPCILIGAGWWQYGNIPNFYTKLLLRATLSKKYIHSVRDEYTKEMLESIGIKNVINTSCPTMWKLTKQHCSEIRKEKGTRVIFTITDYNKDFINDKKMIDILLKNYETVMFWPQGMGDIEYYENLDVDKNKIKVIMPSLEAYVKELDCNNTDFVGTRLHGGVKALQNKVRTLIIAIDNRAIEKNKDFNLSILERKDIDKLEKIINSNIITQVNIPEEKIKIWKKQFKKEECL